MLPWAIALREWREENRQRLLTGRVFPPSPGPLPQWRIDSAGAYFGYVGHPFPSRPAHQVAERLATERGVLGLPGSFFGPGQEGHLRVAFANVGAEVLAGLTRRLEGFAV